MTHRIFKHAGQVTDRIDTYLDARHISPDVTAATEVAAALGVAVETVTVEHVEVLPAVEVTIPPARPEPTAPLTTLSAAEVAALPPAGNGPIATVKAILAKADADITAAEIKTLVLLMARYFLRKWLDGWR